MTLSELNTFLTDKLESPLGKREAAATARLLLEDVLGVDRTKLLTRGERTIEPETEAMFRRFVQRIADGEPPQYVVGKTRFMGMDLRVTPATLIPRPETAELVDIIVNQYGSAHGLHALDVGTGSGCISIALSRALPFADITALDISNDALAVARENAANLHAKIDFLHADILNPPAKITNTAFDFIVSNPPYIAESERDSMEVRVKDHEPESALFVPDSDPLLFYRAIADIAGNADLFFEINPLFSNKLQKMLKDKGFDCNIHRDSQGKNRFAVAQSLHSQKRNTFNG